MAAEYQPKAITSKISATSRASVKIRDSYYTLEYSEERIVPDFDDINLDLEKKKLWEDVNATVDDQVSETIYALTGKR